MQDARGRFNPESISPSPGNTQTLSQQGELRNPFRHPVPEQAPGIQRSRNSQSQSDTVIGTFGCLGYADNVTLFMIFQNSQISQGDAQVGADHTSPEVAWRFFQLFPVVITKRQLCHQPLCLKSGGRHLQMVSVIERCTGIDDGKPVVANLISFGSSDHVMTELVGTVAACQTKRKHSPSLKRVVKRPSLAICLHRQQGGYKQSHEPGIFDQWQPLKFSGSNCFDAGAVTGDSPLPAQ